MRFPSSREMLAELVSEESYTRRGQRRKAEMIANMARMHSLGNVQIEDFPEDAVYANETPTPCNVIIDVGNPDAEELVVFHGHFDTVPLKGDLKNEYMQAGRNPHDLVPDRNDQDLYYGLGAYDMLSGVTAILRSLHSLELPPFRRVRAILVCGEENDSEGTHAAFSETNNLFKGVTGVVSTEISGYPRPSDRRLVIVGRPGRIALDLEIFAEAIHIGAITRDNMESLLGEAMGKVLLGLKNLSIPSHEHDTNGFLKDRSRCVFKEGSTSKTPAMTASGHGFMRLEVSYTDPEATVSDIISIVDTGLRQILGNDHFKLTTMKERLLPFARPWLEDLYDLNRPFVPQAIDIVKKIIGNEDRVDVVGDCPVSDENFIANKAASHPMEGGIPLIGIPANGGKQHKGDEHVYLKTMDDHVIPSLRAIAATQERFIPTIR